MKTYGVILAGGKSSRFNGVDKSWLQWNNKPLIAHVIERVAPQVDQLIISANTNLEKYRSTGYPVVPDDDNSLQGPLAGIYSTMNFITTQQHENEDIYVLTTPCDMPLIPENILEVLMQDTPPLAPRVAKDNNRIQPLVSLLPLSILSHLKTYLDSGQRKVEKWILSSNPDIIDLSFIQECFVNVNDNEELQNLISQQLQSTDIHS